MNGIDGIAGYRFPLFTFASWLVLNLVFWSSGSFSLHQLWLYQQTTGALFSNKISPVTAALGILTVVYSADAFRTVHRSNVVVRIFLSCTVPFAGTALFEIVYLNIPYFVRPEIFNMAWVDEIELASWLVLGLSSARFWKFGRATCVSIATFWLGFALWALIGFPHIYEASKPYIEYALLLNIVTKISSFMIFLSLIHPGSKRATRPR